MLHHQRAEMPQINAGSMADIAFLLLVFFLVTTTMDSEKGLMAKLAPYEENQEPTIIHQRNVMVILINAENNILLNGEITTVNQIKEEVKTFIINEKNEQHLPQKKQVNIPLLGQHEVSKHVISVQNDNGTSYETYIQVRNELIAAYNELRDEAAQKHFNTTYQKLKDNNDKQRLNALKKLYPQRISEAIPNPS